MTSGLVADIATLEIARRPLRRALASDRAPPFPWVALLFAASIVVTAIVTGAYLREIPASRGAAWSTGWPALRDGRWWTLASSFVLTRDWFMATSMSVFLGGVLALYERRAGHGRALAVAAVGHAVGTVVLSVAFAPLQWTGVPMLVKAANNLDYGGSMAIAAACGALAARLRDRRFTLLVASVTLLALPVHHQMADWGHLVAVPLGYATHVVTAKRRLHVGRRVVWRVAALVGMLGIPLSIGTLATTPAWHGPIRWLCAYSPQRFFGGAVWTLPLSALVTARPDALGTNVVVPMVVLVPYVLGFGPLRPLCAFIAGHVVATLSAAGVILGGMAIGWSAARVLFTSVDAGVSAGLAAAGGGLVVALYRTRWRAAAVAVVAALVLVFARRLFVEPPHAILADAEHLVALGTGAFVETQWGARRTGATPEARVSLNDARCDR